MKGHEIRGVFIVVLVGLILGAFILWMEPVPVDHKKSAVPGQGEKAAHEPTHPKDEKKEGIELSEEIIKETGIEVAIAGPATIKRALELPGEITLDQNRVAHVVPRVAGMASEVRKRLSEPVMVGEVIAVMESRELAELKSEYATALKRQELARATFARAQRLWKEGIAAEKEFLASKQALAEAGIAVDTAAQKLLALGLSEADLHDISHGTQKNLARYELRAPLDGVVVEKHIVTGEALKEDTQVFVIADLSTVWAEITIFAKDLDLVRLGQTAVVRSSLLGLEAEGMISYVGPLVGEETRTAKAHIHLPNPDGRWRPGLFVTAEIIQEEVTAPVAVAAEAVQSYREQTVVFVQEGQRFELRPVELGRSDGRFAEVVKGLSTGERYVARNSFVLKAELGRAGAVHEH